MGFFSNILQKLGIGSKDVTLLRHLPPRRQARLLVRQHRRRPGRSRSSMSSRSWSSARQLTRRS